jgi:hypothetical protein
MILIKTQEFSVLQNPLKADLVKRCMKISVTALLQSYRPEIFPTVLIFKNLILLEYE